MDGAGRDELVGRPSTYLLSLLAAFMGLQKSLSLGISFDPIKRL